MKGVIGVQWCPLYNHLLRKGLNLAHYAFIVIVIVGFTQRLTVVMLVFAFLRVFAIFISATSGGYLIAC